MTNLSCRETARHESARFARLLTVDSDDRTGTPGKLPVFVYGTLREGHGNWSWALRGRTDRTVQAVMPQARLVTGGGFPYLLPDEGHSAKGELMWLTAGHAHQVMTDLDTLEGYDPDNPDHSHYIRVRSHVLTDDGPVEAWVYIPAPNHEAELRRLVNAGRLIEVPDGDWNRFREPAHWDEPEPEPSLVRVNYTTWWDPESDEYFFTSRAAAEQHRDDTGDSVYEHTDEHGNRFWTTIPD